MNGREINRILHLGANHSLFRQTGDFYQLLNDFPGILIDSRGYIRFETQEEYLNNHFIQRGERLHIRNGISALPNFIRFTEEQLFILTQIEDHNGVYIGDIDNNNQAERRPRNIDSIDRNQRLVREVKRIRNNTCQICRNSLQIGPNSFYSEVHHIQPLGAPHNGQDIKSNMICVCPNCHKILDYGFVPIEVEIVNLPNHTINRQYIEYHNNRVL